MFHSDEFYSISRALEKHYVLFSKLWSMGKPQEDLNIQTACITFDKVGGQIGFKINPNFWKSLTNVQKEFVISHEYLHVILYHGLRTINLKSKEEHMLANIAMDIVVNHLLVNRFSFYRSEIDPESKYCWIDTVFKNSKDVLDNKSFEYYFLLLKENKDDLDSMLVDDHSDLESFASQEFSDVLSENLSKEDIESIKDIVSKEMESLKESDCKNAGVNPGNLFKQILVGYVKKKSKWETVIKRWANAQIKDKDIEQWSKPNRRLAMMSSNFLLPSDAETDYYEKEKINVWFFQDTSGSCIHLAERFFKAAKSLPEDKFNIRLFCFDTQIYETSLASGKLYGFGGTAFHIIENYIQSEIRKTNCKYPKAVFVITDGYGTIVNPAKPERWYWFLSTSHKNCIPEKCNTFSLSNFE